MLNSNEAVSSQCENTTQPDFLAIVARKARHRQMSTYSVVKLLQVDVRPSTRDEVQGKVLLRVTNYS